MNAHRQNPVPEHIFISYSQKDKGTAEALVAMFRREGIPAWQDYVQLMPKTPDWERAVRDAIENSFAVVLLASTHSRESRYVRGELSVAESKGRHIYPVWIDGTEWSDCIPLGMMYSQYIDARQERREQGFAELCYLLKQLIQDTTPKHYLVSPLRRSYKFRIGGVDSSLGTLVCPPLGFVSVELTETDGTKEGYQHEGIAAFLRITDYSCVQKFLDDLYINYLSNRFKPYTYGTDWIIEENWIFAPRLLVPWSWLVSRHVSILESSSQWLLQNSVSECGLHSRTEWRVRKVSDVDPVGLAVYDERIYRVMRNGRKAESFLRRTGIITDQPLEQVSSDYRFRFVLGAYQSWLCNRKAGPAVVQTQEPVSEEMMNFWQSY